LTNTETDSLVLTKISMFFFQLKYGSFTSILHDPDLGQEALVTQMDRFFTVWAWSQSFDAEDQFSEHIGG
jgi:hypothetical protein